MSCHYDCSENRTPAAIPEYSDISGIGVIVGYTVTAGITVFIITGYYFIAHDPELNPFRSEDGTVQPQLHTPHPIDRLVLDRSRGLWRKLRKKDTVGDVSIVLPTGRRSKIDKALLKCVLTLSDLQILTGLSILISGYAQLHCGLSVYHWQILVYLTWFCSLTHLSCLTFLRNHLYNHPGERLWRLLGMGALVAMLIVALLPTGNYTQNTDPANYAICSFRHLKPIQQDSGSHYADYYEDTRYDYASMIISVLLMGLSFLSRVVRLHRSLAIGVVTRSRRYLSERVRRVLRRIYEKCRSTSAPSSQEHPTRRIFLGLKSPKLKNMWVYRPFLATYLATDAVLDLWSSLILEVWLLLVSFAWGVYNLNLSMGGYSKEAPDPKNWTFGQIAPVILLLVPTLSVIELLLESSDDDIASTETDEVSDEPQPPRRSETMEIATNINTAPSDGVRDDPDYDFYKEPWFQSFILYLLWAFVFLSITILFIPVPSPQSNGKLSRKQHVGDLITSTYFLNWHPLAFMLAAVNFILYSLLAEHLPYKLLPKHIFIWTSVFGIYVLCNLFAGVGYLMGLASLITLYIIVCFHVVMKALPTPHNSS